MLLEAGGGIFKKYPPGFGIMYIDIKRIMQSVKVEDGHIILGNPYEYEKYGKKFIIDQVNYFYKWEKLTGYLGIFLNYYMSVCKAFKLPDSIDDLERFKDNISLTLKNKEWGPDAFKQLIRLCHLGNQLNINIKWMKKKFKLDDWVEMFMVVYLYNIIGVKKNLLNTLKLMKKVVSN